MFTNIINLIQMNNKKRKKIINIFNKINPYPKSELLFNSDFELLISVLLSSQTTDIRVNITTKKLYKIANTPKKFIQLGISKLKKCLCNIGLFNKKASYIISLCKIFVEKNYDYVPNNRSFLESLPGVGRKTANVVLNTLYNENTIAVDTHVFRVSNRSKFAIGKNNIEVEKKILSVVPNNYQNKIHNWLIHHGKYICTARVPKCDICCIKYYCEFKKKT